MTDVTVPLMGTVTYTFPKMIDPDAGDTVSLSGVKDQATGIQPSFIAIPSSGLYLTINPILMSQVLAYTI